MGSSRRRSAGAAAAAGLTSLLIAGCGTAGASQPSQQEIAEVFAGWNAALSTVDPQRVADRYAPDAVLLPTQSNKVRTNRAEIVDYFEHFLAQQPRGEILQSHVKVLDADSAIDAGTYRFTLSSNGAQRTVDARYTFVYERIDGKWLIINHHSSAMPESKPAG